jgi:hypothetical protein
MWSGPLLGIQRSFTMHGDAALARQARRDLVAEYGSARSDIGRTAAAVTVGELLEAYMGSAHLWKPADTTPAAPPPDQRHMSAIRRG